MYTRHVDSNNPGRSNLVFSLGRPIPEAEISNRPNDYDLSFIPAKRIYYNDHISRLVYRW